MAHRTLRVTVGTAPKQIPVGLTGDEAERAANLFTKLARWGVRFCFQSKEQLFAFVRDRQIPESLSTLLDSVRKTLKKGQDMWLYLTSFEPAPLRRGVTDVIPAELLPGVGTPSLGGARA